MVELGRRRGKCHLLEERRGELRVLDHHHTTDRIRRVQREVRTAHKDFVDLNVAVGGSVNEKRSFEWFLRRARATCALSFC